MGPQRLKENATVMKYRGLGWTHREIGMLLGISQAAVSKRLRTIKRTAKMMGEDRAFRMFVEALQCPKKE